MKRIYTFLASFILTMGYVSAQTPQAINYQGIARDASGNEYANTNIGIRIRINDVSALGATLYEETHNVTTNQFGLFVLQIGNGTPTVGTFTGIDWSTNDKWLNVGMDPTGGTAFTEMGASQMVSVPYALYAETSGDGGLWSENGNDVYYNSGNVGVGTNTPTGIMEISGTVANPGDPLLQLSDASTTNGRIRLRDGGASANNFSPTIDGHAEGNDSKYGLGLLSWSANDNDPTDKGMLFRSRRSDGSPLTVSPTYTWVNGPSSTEFQMQLTAAGNLGIGKTATEKLDVDGNIQSTGFIMPTGAQNNYVLASDATGTATWTDPSTLPGSSIWSQNGNDAFYSTGNVGIGTNSPSAQLNLSQNAGASTDAFIELNDLGAPNSHLKIYDGTTISGHFQPIIEGKSIGTGFPNRTGLILHGILDEDGDDDVGIKFRVYNNSLNSLTSAALFTWHNNQTEVMRIESTGNVGIGTSTPNAKLNISMDASTSSEPFIELTDETAPTGYLRFRDLTSISNEFNPTIEAQGVGTGVSRTGLNIIGRLSDDNTGNRGMFFDVKNSSGNRLTSAPAYIWANDDAEIMRLDANDNLGLGTTDVRSKLHIADGDVYLDNSANGIILTAPNGSCYRVTVDNTGALTPTAITCP